MLVVRRLMAGLVTLGLVMISAACQSTPTTVEPPASSRQTLSVIAPPPTAQPAGTVVWGKVAYCNCLADAATTNVTSALKQAKLTVNLKELSPREGWLYFAVTFDPQAATAAQVKAALRAGGAQVIPGPP